MSEIKKYMFDVRFDKPKEKKKEIVEEEQEQEQEVEIEAKEPPPPMFSEEELNRACIKARKEGASEEKRKADEEKKKADEATEKLHVETMKAIAIELATIQDVQKEINKQITSDSFRITLAAVKKMFPIITEKHGMEEVEALVKKCMPLIIEEPQITIYVNEKFLELLRTTLTEIITNSGYKGRFLVAGDKKIQTADCRIEWNSGGMERNNEKLWKDIEEIIIENTLPPKTNKHDAVK